MQRAVPSIATAGPMPSPGLPSPTLTNPDMILPYDDDYSRESATPSPPPQTIMRPSAGPRRSSAGLSSHPPFAKLADPPVRTKAGISPRTTPPNDVYFHGGPLSDIDEHETTPKGERSRNDLLTTVTRRSPQLPSSPTLEHLSHSTNGYLAAPRYPFSGRSFSDTTSDSGMSDVFEGHEDDQAIEDDSGDDTTTFGEDDEDFAESENIKRLRAARLDYHGGINGKIPEDSQDPYLSAALSKRAEKILANAKKRLDNMEGNLNRARHSLIISSSPLMTTNSSSNNSPVSPKRPQPPATQNNENRIHPGLGITPAKHRQLQLKSSSSFNIGHARVFSETSIPSSLYTTPQKVEVEIVSPRSASASEQFATTRKGEGLSPAAAAVLKGIRQEEEADARRKAAANTAMQSTLQHFRSSPSYEHHLDPLNEDDAQSVGHTRQLTTSASLYNMHATEPHDYSNGLSRSRSTAQMRDLRVQMQDLKGKISTLQQRAKEESMKRRSLQSLRTQSPFTAAEQWYTASGDYKPMGSDENDRPLILEHHQTEYDRPKEEDVRVENHDPEDPENEGYYEESVAQSYYEDADEHLQADYEDSYQDFDGGETEGEEILQEHDRQITHPTEAHTGVSTLQLQNSNEARQASQSIEREDSNTPVGSRHEDREDAFDYQNFFLHSGMGNYSHPDHIRRESYSSNDSVETTRGVEYRPMTNGPTMVPQRASRLPPHQRNMSSDTVSTVDSFATATEGLSSHRASDNEDDDDNDNSSPVYFHTPEPGHPITQAPVSQSPQPQPQPQPQPEPESSSLRPFRPSHNTPSPNRPPTAVQIHAPQTTQHKITSPQPSIDDPTPSVRSFPLINRSKSAASFNTTSAPSIRSLPRPDTAGLVNHLSGASASPHNSVAFGHAYSQSTPHTAPLPGYGQMGANGIYSTTAPSIQRSGSAVSVATMSSFSTTASSIIGGGSSGSPLKSQQAPPPQILKPEDRALVERLVESLGEVCMALRNVSSSSNSGSSLGGAHPGSGAAREIEMDVWRARLDGARRVLDGEGADL